MFYFIFAAITMYFLGSFGLTSCFISLYIIYKQTLLHNAFGLICAVHSIIESCILFFTVFVTFSIVFFYPDAEKTPFIAFMGFVAATCHTASVYLHVIKAANRSFAVLLPVHYKTAFTVQKTLLFLVISSGFCFIHVILYISYSCHYYYSRIYFAWIFNRAECEATPGSIINLGTQIFLVILTLSCDAVTLLCLLQTMRKAGVRELKFFFQSCLTSILHALMLILPTIIKPLLSNSFLQFLAGNPSMMFFHAMNEFLFVIFIFHSNRDSRTSSQTPLVLPANYVVISTAL